MISLAARISPAVPEGAVPTPNEFTILVAPLTSNKCDGEPPIPTLPPPVI